MALRTFNTLAIAAILGMSVNVQADSSKPAGSGPNPYSDCGIGAALFSNTGWAAVTSNVIWDLGSTAITSATASPETCSGKNIKTALFIRDTYTQLVEESAAGDGMHLKTALNLVECGEAQQSNAIQAVRSEMGAALSNADYQGKTHLEKSSDFYNVINKAAARHCSV
ncbi:DUF3015 family protein [Pseudomethylobacillus aquaticus]|nr:DUF3015 family protein [Pseudomethylobacillus aquaticus]